MTRFSLGILEKAIEGGKISGFLATKTVQFWSGTGKDFLMSFWREQNREIRHRMLKESKASMEQQLRAFRGKKDPS